MDDKMIFRPSRKCRYFQVDVAKHTWYYYYSSVKNIHNKYVIWITKTNRTGCWNVREFNKKKDAIKWAKNRMLMHLKSLGRFSEVSKWEPAEKLTRVEII